jgi:asparagine synthase (glutamine-hydrolysing)
MMYLDTLTYLPDDILAKVDRASMGVSLEARVPLLAHELVEFAWRLPLALKRRDGRTKWLLREVAYRHVPRALLERPKQGFAVPVGAWLRGPLREWASDVLSVARLRADGYLDPGPVAERLRDHLSGKREGDAQLWFALVFQTWLDGQRAGAERAHPEPAAERRAT